VICPKCGAENSGNTTFCGLCLTRFDEPAAVGPPASSAAQGRPAASPAPLLGAPPAPAAFPDGNGEGYGAPDLRPSPETGPKRSGGFGWFAIKLAIGTVVLLVAFFVLATFSDSSLGTNIGKRTVSQYDATFVALTSGTEETRDVQSTLRITYDIGLIPQSRGHKSIGPEDVDSISVTDESGKPLKSWLTTVSQKEKDIGWAYPAKWRGKQTVIVQFVSRKAEYSTLGGTDVLYSADWPGRFDEPVKSATYTLILPPGPAPAGAYTFPNAGTLSPNGQGLQLAFREDEPSGIAVIFGSGELTDDAQQVKDRIPMARIREKMAKSSDPLARYNWVWGVFGGGAILVFVVIVAAWGFRYTRMLAVDASDPRQQR
jgi:hypothetical protein